MKDRVIVVTGAAGVLGRAVCAEASARGALVAGVDFSGSLAVSDHIRLALAGVDLTDPASAEQAMSAVRAELGRIDALLNIAGGFTWQAIAGADAGVWETMFALNLKTSLNATRAALPYLLESQGAIVNVGAAGALKAGAGMGPYAASKAAVHKLTESLAEEMKGKVRVNALLPSIIDTAKNRADMPDADPSTWVTPQELAAVMLFFASAEASAITGALVPVTGRV